MADRLTDSDRRTFIKRGLLAGGSLALAAAGAPTPAQARRTHRARRSGAARRRPNILVILVDQLRAPAWVPASVALDTLLPNLAALRRESVSFERHYTAANDCSPSRGTLLTGLYSHQTRCMITGRSRLSPGFPTWGTLLRDMDYETTWWGKWHLNPHAERAAAPVWLFRRYLPLAQRRPRSGHRSGPVDRRSVSGVVRRKRWPGAVVLDGLAGQSPRRGLVVPLYERNPAGEQPLGVGQPDPAQLRDPGRSARPRQAAAAPLAAGNGRSLVRPGAILRARTPQHVEWPDEHLSAAAGAMSTARSVVCWPRSTPGPRCARTP